MIRFLKHIVLFAAGLLAGRKISAAPKRAEPPPRRGWKHFGTRLLMLLPVLAAGGFLVAASGIIPIKASSGHWAITRWFLEFSMSRSIATHSLGIQAPPLDDPAMVVRGAGHFETGCRPCHGSVTGEIPEVPRSMTPYPPTLPDRVPEWNPEELFYIVNHGLKFTGMPAWPARHREDEVWSMVAFLLRMPGMELSEYQQLVYGSTLREDVEPAPASEPTDVRIEELEMGDVSEADAGSLGVPDVVIESCARCHGLGGEGREVSAFPRLAGQQAQYLYASLVAYANGERHSGIMGPAATGMTAEEMREAALYFAGSHALPGLGFFDRTGSAAGDSAGVGDAAADVAPASAGDGARSDVALGRRIAYEGIPERKVPSCADCHGPSDTPRNPIYPELAGQYAEYLVLQLELFATGVRGGTTYAHVMRPTASQLTEDQMFAVARFYESLGMEDL